MKPLHTRIRRDAADTSRGQLNTVVSREALYRIFLYPEIAPNARDAIALHTTRAVSTFIYSRVCLTIQRQVME